MNVYQKERCNYILKLNIQSFVKHLLISFVLFIDLISCMNYMASSDGMIMYDEVRRMLEKADVYFKVVSWYLPG
jgi:hypothetical protein